MHEPRLSPAFLASGSSSFADFLSDQAPELLPSRRSLPEGSAAPIAAGAASGAGGAGSIATPGGSVGVEQLPQSITRLRLRQAYDDVCEVDRVTVRR